MFLYILASLLVMQVRERETARLGPNEERREEGEETEEGEASWEEIRRLMV